MAVDWESVQKRFIDPFSPVDSDNVSSLTAAISYGTGRGICNGLWISLVNNQNIMISVGVIMKDFIVTRFITPVILNVEETNRGPGWNYVVLEYEYRKEDPPPVAIIDVIPTGDYDPAKHVIIGRAEVDLTTTLFLSVDWLNREENTSVKRTEDTSILELCDTPDWCANCCPYNGQAHQILRVNPAEDGFIFSDDLTKADPSDPVPGYLCDKVDNYTLVVCSSTHRMCVPPYTVNADKLDDLDACDFLQLSGATSPCCDISWNNWKLTDLADPTALQDAVNLQCLNCCIAAEACARTTCDDNLQCQIDDLFACDGAQQVEIGDLQDAMVNHNHDGRYYTETETDALLANKSNLGHTHSFVSLSDTPVGYDAGKILCSTGSGTVWVTAPSGGSTTFIGLTDTPSYHSAGKFLCSNGSQLDWTNAPAYYINELSDVNTSGVVNGCVLCFDGADWIPGTGGGGGGTTDFVGLTDTPANYGSVGQILCTNGTNCVSYANLCDVALARLSFLALCDTPVTYTVGCHLKVNSSGNGLEYVSPPSVGSGKDCFCDLDDTPGTYIASCFLRVNSAATAIEFVSTTSSINDLLDLDDTPTDYCENCLLCSTTGGFIYVNADDILASGCFISLADTPASYPAGACALIARNNQVCFISPGSFANCMCFVELNDTPPNYGSTGQLLCTTGSSLSYTSTMPPMCCIGDVDVAGLLTGDALVWNGTCWVAADVQITELRCVGDVSSSTPPTNSYLRWTGTEWCGDAAGVLPDQVQTFAIVPTTYNDPVLTWTASGCADSGYMVCVTTAADVCVCEQAVAAGGTSATLTGLARCQNYKLYVAGVNPGGCGPWSDALCAAGRPADAGFNYVFKNLSPDGFCLEGQCIEGANQYTYCILMNSWISQTVSCSAATHVVNFSAIPADSGCITWHCRRADNVFCGYQACGPWGVCATNYIPIGVCVATITSWSYQYATPRYSLNVCAQCGGWNCLEVYCDGSLYCTNNYGGSGSWTIDRLKTVYINASSSISAYVCVYVQTGYWTAQGHTFTGPLSTQTQTVNMTPS